MRISEDQRQRTEDRIRAAMDRLLRGDLPAGGKCDVQTLAREATVTRAALYTTYLHLKEEFERRREQLREAGVISDPRDAQITRLKDHLDKLQARIANQDKQISDLTAFRATAVSRLAAQHDEILRLRAALADGDNVRSLPTRPD